MARNSICILLVFVLLSLFATGCDSSPQKPATTHIVSEETSSWPMDLNLWIEAPTITPIPQSQAVYAQQYYHGFVVEARMLELLPYIYALPEKSLDRNLYFVLRLEVLDVVAGSGVPKEIYYLMDGRYYTYSNLEQYDSLLISMRQLSYGSYLLLNVTEGRYDRFEPLFASGTVALPQQSFRLYPDPTEVTQYTTLSILPYNNGKLARSVFLQDYWEDDLPAYDELLVAGRHNFPFHVRDSIEEAKESIRACREEYESQSTQSDLQFFSTVQYPDIYPDKEKYLELCSFDTGVFTQITDRTGNTVFCRMVNGFYTNEYYTFSPGKPMFSSGIQFTQEDLINLPDLLPLLQLARNEDHRPYGNSYDLFDGYYYKTDRGIFGVVRLFWGASTPTPTQIIILALPNGQVQKVSADVLGAYLDGDWEKAEHLSTWDTIGGTVYCGDVIYENRADEYVYPFFKKIYLTPDGNGIYYGYQDAGILRATLVDPEVIGLDAMLESDQRYWKEHGLGYQELTNTVLFAWRLQENTDPRPLRYLLKLDDGSLFLATGYDYTGVYEDGQGTKTIQYIFRLTVDGGKYAFFDEWESSVKRIKDKRPELYELWKQLKNTYL